MTVRLTRREFTIAGGAVMLAPPALAQNSALLARAIPSSGERLPAVGGYGDLDTGATKQLERDLLVDGVVLHEQNMGSG